MMNKSITYSGQYKDIYYEILNRIIPEKEKKHWKVMGVESKWTFYIFIKLDLIPEKYNPDSFWLKSGLYKGLGFDKWGYDYDKHEIIGGVIFHGGITFYSKHSGFEPGDLKMIKIGCDYLHLQDDHKTYDENIIYEDVKTAIDSFLKMVPEYSVPRKN